MHEQPSVIATLWADARAGRLSRRDVLVRGMRLGLTAPVIGALLAACGGDDDDEATVTRPAATASGAGASPTTAQATATAPSGGSSTAPAATATPPAGPTATTAAASPTTPPQTGTPGHGRGVADLLRILYWQTATNLNPHFSQGNNNSAPLKLVIESLMEVDPDGNFIPVLVEQVPTLENGLLAQDGTSVTYTLKEGLVWSDGTPLTTEDVIFTWQWVMSPGSTVTSIGAFQDIDGIDAADERTFTIRFQQGTPVWFRAFSIGTGLGGQVLPKHLLEDYQGAKSAEAPYNLMPIGTGPYKVTDFKPGDVVTYEINESYREPDKPFFKQVEFKGGGDATAAARAVLQSGEVDYALNLQVEKALLEELTSGGVGSLVIALGSNVEQIYINFADPNTEVDGARSEPSTQHPFFSDLKVRQALALACDRQTIAEQFYGPTGQATANILAGPKVFASPNTSFTFDLAAAGALLDEAGWTASGDTRSKVGVEMKVLYQTTINPLRQKTQEVNKQNWEQLGIATELKSIDAGVFFSADPGNTDTWTHFYADLEMATNGGGLFPIDYMAYYKSNDPARDIPQKANNWSGLNQTRWVNAEYNTLWDQARTELDPAKQAELFIGMNDIAVNDVAAVPLVHRAQVDGASNKLKGVNRSPWSDETYNIANWYFEE